MSPQTLYINAVYEDVISLAVIKRLLQCSTRPVVIDHQMPGNGSGYILKRIREFHKASQYQPFIILLDADSETCAVTVLNKTIPAQLRHEKCIFRIVMHEIETWLLADTTGISTFLGISSTLIPQDVETISDPKRLIITIAGKSKKRTIREGIPPAKGKSARIGIEYNTLLLQFVNNHWNIELAAKNSESLRRAVGAVKRLAAMT